MTDIIVRDFKNYASNQRMVSVLKKQAPRICEAYDILVNAMQVIRAADDSVTLEALPDLLLWLTNDTGADFAYDTGLLCSHMAWLELINEGGEFDQEELAERARDMAPEFYFMLGMIDAEKQNGELK